MNMYTIEFYKGLDKVDTWSFNSKERCEELGKSFLKNVKEYDNTYCMIWLGGKMVSYITK